MPGILSPIFLIQAILARSPLPSAAARAAAVEHLCWRRELYLYSMYHQGAPTWDSLPETCGVSAPFSHCDSEQTEVVLGCRARVTLEERATAPRTRSRPLPQDMEAATTHSAKFKCVSGLFSRLLSLVSCVGSEWQHQLLTRGLMHFTVLPEWSRKVHTSAAALRAAAHPPCRSSGGRPAAALASTRRRRFSAGAVRGLVPCVVRHSRSWARYSLYGASGMAACLLAAALGWVPALATE
jgi:hypothetical protein